MVFITVRQSPFYHQMSLEEYLFQNFESPVLINENTANTRTYQCRAVSPKFLEKINVDGLIAKLKKFNDSTAELRNENRESLYKKFYIPKKSGGLRKINAPKPDLMDALRRLKRIFENDFHALYHTSAFAYIENRCTVDAVKRHQSNESKWFGKLDLHDFFGSTTLSFVLDMFSMIFPFSEVVKRQDGKVALETALELAFLDGGLPQGTPISPTITNIMMIPIDFELNKSFRNLIVAEPNHTTDGEKCADTTAQAFIYTRYADDFIISSKYHFDIKKVEENVVRVLNKYHAPFSINTKKTRYGSSAGSNWNLGVMLNKDNEITVGHKKKKRFQAMLYNYVTDKRNGVSWSKEDLMTLHGLYSYYKMVEGDVIDAIVKHMNEKLDVDVIALIKGDLR